MRKLVSLTVLALVLAFASQAPANGHRAGNFRGGNFRGHNAGFGFGNSHCGSFGFSGYGYAKPIAVAVPFAVPVAAFPVPFAVPVAAPVPVALPPLTAPVPAPVAVGAPAYGAVPYAAAPYPVLYPAVPIGFTFGGYGYR